MRLGTVTLMTFQEARRRRLVLAVAVMGALFLILFAVGFYYVYRDTRTDPLAGRPEALNFFLLTGLYVVNFLTVVLTVLASVDSISGEIQSGTIHTVLTKPLPRRDLILGKWLGLSVMVAVFVAAMGAAMMAIVWGIGHYLPPHPVQAIALMVLEGVVILTISIFGGTSLSTLANGVVVFMLYGFAFIAGWMEHIAGFAHNRTIADLGIAISLLVPSEVLWRRAAYLMQPPLLRQLGLGPFSSTTAPSPAAVVYACVYVTVLLVWASRRFHRRDL